MTTPTQPTLVPVPFGSWVNLGTGPLQLAVVGVAVSLSIAQNATAPDNTFTGDVFAVGPNTGVVEFDGTTDVWAKIRGTDTPLAPVSVLVTPVPVVTPTEPGAENELPTGSPVLTPRYGYVDERLLGGVFEIPNALGNAAGLLRSISIKSASAQSSALTLILFSQKPANTVFIDATTGSNLDIRDLPLLLGVYKFGLPSNNMATSLYQLNDINQMVVAGAGSLYGLLVANGSFNFPGASDMSVSLGIESA